MGLDEPKLGIIAKNTILKAIHNNPHPFHPHYLLGIIAKNTILKAIHNLASDASGEVELGIIAKNTILKAIHNQDVGIIPTLPVGNYS